MNAPHAGISTVRVVCKSRFFFRRKHRLMSNALIASAYSGFVIWHGGLSGSIPLSIATPGHPFEALTGARAGLPRYADWGRLLTPAIKLDFAVRQARLAGVTLARGNTLRLPQIIEFLNRERSRRQFAPVVDAAQFGNGRLAGLRPEAFFLALRGGRIVGTLAAWNQSGLRQTHVERYPVFLGLIRPLYNALAALSPLKPLPAPGERIPCVYLACAATEDDDVRLFRFLMRAALESLRHGSWSFAIAALHEADPLAPVLSEFRSIPAAGRLFAVHYPGEPLAIDPIARRVPCLEAGCL